ncbi:transposase [Streptomyces sp. I05A-00742]|uniref:transposase n=1 Tax=Streptomyces sp. I05A-00742 TaxID=2732853 RepID=UPI0014886025|nr:transposase [Streptomyces sp. I05A-00742]
MRSREEAELLAAIRSDADEEKLSVRALARRYGVQRALVREVVNHLPLPRKPPRPRPSVLDPYKETIDALLRADRQSPPEQQLTARALFEHLVAEDGMTGVSIKSVRDYVVRRRYEIEAEAPGFVSLGSARDHRAGEVAEVAMGDAYVNLRGVRTRCSLFVFHLTASGEAVHRVFLSQGHGALLEGHVHAFRALGGVPTGQVRYDTLNAKVKKALGFYESGDEPDRWSAFRAWAGLDVVYGQSGTPEWPGAGEAMSELGRFRRAYLSPGPEVASVAELNALIEGWERAEARQRRPGSRVRTVGQRLAVEGLVLKDLPEEHFETGRPFTATVDRFSLIGVRTNRYSVPVRLIGKTVKALLHASELVIHDGRGEVARHERLIHRGDVRIDLDHYLEGLLRNPGSLPGATVLDQARSAGKFTPVHDAWWDAVRAAHGEEEARYAMSEVLLLHRHLAHDQVVAGIAAALNAGELTADAVALEARRAADRDTAADGSADDEGGGDLPPSVSSLALRRVAALPPDNRPLPSVAVYDQLLRGTPPAATRTDSEGVSS